MATYAIGDVHGCLDGLKQLLKTINYQPDHDKLLFAGDLVGRGPESYETIKFVKQLNNCHIVLGNHEIHLLCSYYLDQHTKVSYLDSFKQQNDADAIIDWLCHKPLCHYDPTFKTVLVHAGIHPSWKLSEVIEYSEEFSSQLKALATRKKLLEHLYGNFPDIWRTELVGFDRLRVILNIFTRIRYLTSSDCRLNFFCKTSPSHAPKELKAWFNHSLNIPKDHTIIFGHWAHLKGSISTKTIENIDGGYVHHGHLIALRLEDNLRFNVYSPLSE